MNICVLTSLTRRGEVEPHVFFVGSRRLIVAEIRERWVEQSHRCYQVTCEDGRGFLLRFDTETSSWELAGVYAARLRPSPAVQARAWWMAFRRA